MIITTFNIRGLGGVLKRNKVKELVRVQKVNFLAIRETKMKVITPNFCYNLWGSEDCERSFPPSEGNSGCIVFVWNKVNLSLTQLVGQCIIICRGRSSNLGHPTSLPYKVNFSH